MVQAREVCRVDMVAKEMWCTEGMCMVYGFSTSDLGSSCSKQHTMGGTLGHCLVARRRSLLGQMLRPRRLANAPAVCLAFRLATLGPCLRSLPSDVDQAKSLSAGDNSVG